MTWCIWNDQQYIFSACLHYKSQNQPKHQVGFIVNNVTRKWIPFHHISELTMTC